MAKYYFSIYTLNRIGLKIWSRCNDQVDPYPNGKLIKNLVKEINKYEKQKFWQA